MTKRVLVLFNHGTAAEIECDNWVRLGYEVYLPKHIPKNYDLSHQAVTITTVYDKDLSIPTEDLALLNDHNFYDDPPTPAITRIINRYFSVLDTCLEGSGPIWLCEVFKGTVLLRVFGLMGGGNYEKLLNAPRLCRYEFPYLVGKSFYKFLGINFSPQVKHLSRATYVFNRIKDRVFLAGGYQNTAESEPRFFKNRNVWLPLGIPKPIWAMEDTWKGSLPRIMFVCPTISIPYYQKIFVDFMAHLGDMPHDVFGRQPPGRGYEILNPHIKGYLSRDILNTAFQEYKCMFYHSCEPYHLHYHPLEAVIFGMPLVFMAGGMLERLAGCDLPGMARSHKEAREKIQRILDGDQGFVDAVVASQKAIVASLRDEELIKAWRHNLSFLNLE